MHARRSAALIMSAALVLVACGDDDDDGGEGAASAPTAAEGTTAPAATGTRHEPRHGAGRHRRRRWRWRLRRRRVVEQLPGRALGEVGRAGAKAAIEAGGGTYISNDAKSSAETQASNVENLISQGANVLVILAQDGTAIKPSVASAISQGVPVIAYDRLIEDPEALYITFDNVKVGELQAEAIFDVVPEGNFVIIKGNSADANADFLRQGYTNAGIPDVGESSDTITIVGETYTDNWDPAIAQTKMEQFLTDERTTRSTPSCPRTTGWPAASSPRSRPRAWPARCPVSGQDGDLAALNRVALGTQTVDVWKDARLLGTAAGEAAVQLCANPDIAAVEGTAPFTSPEGNELTSILLEPQPITQDNLDVVLDAGWIDEATLCEGVEAGSVAACG